MGARPSRALTSRILVLAGLIAAAGTAAAVAQDITESFRSTVRQISPPVSGLEVRVLGRDDALELRNDTGRTVVVEGYDREPYLRFNTDGTVEENRYSPATYLNRDRSGSQKVPVEANSAARPGWREVANDGAFRWFDHRIHITNPEGPPPQAQGREGATKVNDWNVPLTVGADRTFVRGTLFWDPESSDSDGFPFGIVAAVVGGIVILGLLAFLWRRRTGGPTTPAAGKDEAAKEAW